MHTWTTPVPVNTEKLQRAIFVLETLNSTHSKLVLEALTEHRSNTFLELMMYTGLNTDELDLQLERLCSTGAVKLEERSWQPRFWVDEKRLSGLVACARALAQGSGF